MTVKPRENSVTAHPGKSTPNEEVSSDTIRELVVSPVRLELFLLSFVDKARNDDSSKRRAEVETLCKLLDAIEPADASAGVVPSICMIVLGRLSDWASVDSCLRCVGRSVAAHPATLVQTTVEALASNEDSMSRVQAVVYEVSARLSRLLPNEGAFPHFFDLSMYQLCILAVVAHVQPSSYGMSTRSLLVGLFETVFEAHLSELAPLMPWIVPRVVDAVSFETNPILLTKLCRVSSIILSNPLLLLSDLQREQVFGSLLSAHPVTIPTRISTPVGQGVSLVGFEQYEEAQSSLTSAIASQGDLLLTRVVERGRSEAFRSVLLSERCVKRICESTTTLNTLVRAVMDLREEMVGLSGGDSETRGTCLSDLEDLLTRVCKTSCGSENAISASGTSGQSETGQSETTDHVHSGIASLLVDLVLKGELSRSLACKCVASVSGGALYRQVEQELITRFDFGNPGETSSREARICWLSFHNDLYSFLLLQQHPNLYASDLESEGGDVSHEHKIPGTQLLLKQLLCLWETVHDFLPSEDILQSLLRFVQTLRVECRSRIVGVAFQLKQTLSGSRVDIIDFPSTRNSAELPEFLQFETSAINEAISMFNSKHEFAAREGIHLSFLTVSRVLMASGAFERSPQNLGQYFGLGICMARDDEAILAGQERQSAPWQAFIAAVRLLALEPGCCDRLSELILGKHFSPNIALSAFNLLGKPDSAEGVVNARVCERLVECLVLGNRVDILSRYELVGLLSRALRGHIPERLNLICHALDSRDTALAECMIVSWNELGSDESGAAFLESISNRVLSRIDTLSNELTGSLVFSILVLILRSNSKGAVASSDLAPVLMDSSSESASTVESVLSRVSGRPGVVARVLSLASIEDGVPVSPVGRSVGATLCSQIQEVVSDFFSLRSLQRGVVSETDVLISSHLILAIPQSVLAKNPKALDSYYQVVVDSALKQTHLSPVVLKAVCLYIERLLSVEASLSVKDELKLFQTSSALVHIAAGVELDPVVRISALQCLNRLAESGGQLPELRASLMASIRKYCKDDRSVVIRRLAGIALNSWWCSETSSKSFHGGLQDEDD